MTNDCIRESFVHNERLREPKMRSAKGPYAAIADPAFITASGFAEPLAVIAEPR